MVKGDDIFYCREQISMFFNLKLFVYLYLHSSIFGDKYAEWNLYLFGLYFKYFTS